MPSPSVALLRTQSDERLVALAAGGHERAFEAIVERYRRALLRHARRYLPDARAEDAVQLSLVSAWSGLRRGDEVRELRPWLHRIVHNVSLNALRVSGYDYEELRDTLEGGGGPAEAAERRAVVRGTLAGLAALPPRQRDALLQIAVEGRSQDEVAADLGLSQGAVRQLVHRARTTLRAAATAVVPLPLATALASAGGGRSDVAVRVAELVSGAGAGATLAKAGAVAVIAGGAVAGPAVVRQPEERSPQVAAAGSAPRTEVRRVTPAPTPPPAAAPVAPAPSSGERDRPSTGAGAGRAEERRRDDADDRGSARGRGREDQHGSRDRDDADHELAPRSWREDGARREGRGDDDDDGGDDDRSGHEDGGEDDVDEPRDPVRDEQRAWRDDDGDRSGDDGDADRYVAPDEGVEDDEHSGDDEPEQVDDDSSGPAGDHD